jgi:hypothetical protein
MSNRVEIIITRVYSLIIIIIFSLDKICYSYRRIIWFDAAGAPSIYKHHHQADDILVYQDILIFMFIIITMYVLVDLS